MSALTQEQSHELRGRLERLREEINERLRVARDTVRPTETNELAPPPGRLDTMQVQQAARMQRMRDDTQLQMVGSALSRIRAGTYGECLKCEEQIDLQRLQTSPESPLCLTCRRQNDA